MGKKSYLPIYVYIYIVVCFAETFYFCHLLVFACVTVFVIAFGAFFFP